MAARTKARRRALDILFEAEARDERLLAVLEQVRARRRAEGVAALNPYTETIIIGVIAHADEIDELITTASVGWPLERMPAVDRAALRIGVWELRWADGIPARVAISEAVAAVTELSTDESPMFVNGVLAGLARDWGLVE